MQKMCGQCCLLNIIYNTENWKLNISHEEID